MQQQLSPENIAIFDPERKYRYLLTRQLADKPSICTFIMLNPSTADEIRNDPTVARCISFAKKWGFGKLNVLNIFALRSTDPKALYSSEDPMGPENNLYLFWTVSGSELVVAAWGVHAKLGDRGDQVTGMLQKITDIHCLGLTKDGIPKHPLYLPGNSTPKIFRKKEV